MKFTFFSPVKIIFGSEHSEAINKETAGFGRQAFVVTGKNQQRVEGLLKELKRSGINYDCFVQRGEPRVEDISDAVSRAKQSEPDFVIALGGGSVIDAGKAIAALLANPQKIHNYLEVIGKGRGLTKKPVPMIAIPTTAGTGAEVTCNSVLKSFSHGVKVSMRSPLMYPDTAIIDPLLSITMPPEITAATGMDALTQLIEAFTSPFATPFTDALCRDGIKRVARSLQRAFHNGEDLDARMDMSLASLYSGIALANAKLGAVHGIAGPMGGMTDASHGAICASLLAPVMEQNIIQLEKNTPNSPALQKYREISAITTNKTDASLTNGIKWIKELTIKMNLKGLRALGLDETHCRLLAEHALKASSMTGNPVQYNYEEMLDLIKGTLANH